MRRIRYRTRTVTKRARRIGRGIGLSLKGGALGRGLSGIGGGYVAEAVTEKVAPQFSTIAGYGGAYLSGGMMGVVGHAVRKMAEGQFGFGFSQTSNQGDVI